MGVIAEKLVRGLERHGGAIRYKARVTEIVVEQGRAVGVTLADGSTIRARRVISNATRWDTFSGQGNDDAQASSQALVNAANTPAKENVWRRRYVPSPSFLSLHLGVRADLIPEGTHCHHLLLEDWERMEDEQGVIFVSMRLLDPDLPPRDTQVHVHAVLDGGLERVERANTGGRRRPMQPDDERLGKVLLA